MEFEDISNEEVPPPMPKKREMLKHAWLQMISMLEDVVVTQRTDGRMCLLGVCSYVLEMLDVVNLARN